MATWTAGWASTQATASWAMVAPRSAAKRPSAATTLRLRRNPGPVKAGLCDRQSSEPNVVRLRIRQQVGLDVAAEQVIGRLDGCRRQHRGELGDLIRGVVGDPHVAD